MEMMQARVNSHESLYFPLHSHSLRLGAGLPYLFDSASADSFISARLPSPTVTVSLMFIAFFLRGSCLIDPLHLVVSSVPKQTTALVLCFLFSLYHALLPYFFYISLIFFLVKSSHNVDLPHAYW